MSRTPRACAPSSSDSRAMRLRSRVVTWTTHSRSRSCWIPNATASAPIRTRAMAESLMLTASTPAAWSRRAASIVRSMRTERGGSISTEMTKRRSARARARPVGGRHVTGRGVAVGPAARCATGTGRSAVGALDRLSRHGTSIAARIAAMCSGVVPQQPPTIAAPAASMSSTIAPK